MSDQTQHFSTDPTHPEQTPRLSLPEAQTANHLYLSTRTVRREKASRHLNPQIRASKNKRGASWRVKEQTRVCTYRRELPAAEAYIYLSRRRRVESITSLYTRRSRSLSEALGPLARTCAHLYGILGSFAFAR